MRTFEFRPDVESEEYSQQIIDDATSEEIAWADFRELLDKETIGIHFTDLIGNSGDEKIKFSTIDPLLIHTPEDYGEGGPYFKGITSIKSLVHESSEVEADVWREIGTLSVLLFIFENDYYINLDYIHYNDITLGLWDDNGNYVLELGKFGSQQPYLEMSDTSGYSLYYFIDQTESRHIPFKLCTWDQETEDNIWCEFLNVGPVGDNQYELTYKATTTNQKYEIYINRDIDNATAFIDHVDITEEGGTSEKTFVLVNNNNTWEIQNKYGDTVDFEDFMNLIGSIVDGSSATVDLIYDPDDMRFNCHYKFDKYNVQYLGEQFTVTFINSIKKLILTLDTSVPEITDVQVTDRFSGGSGSSDYINADSKVSLYINGADLPHYHTPEQPILE